MSSIPQITTIHGDAPIDESVLDHAGAPASDWAASTQNALAGTTAPPANADSAILSSSSHIITPSGSTFLPNTQSAVSTPGNEVPGGWHDNKPAAGEENNTVYSDVSNVLSQVGQAAYNILPTSVTNALGGNTNTNSTIQSSSNSPITTTTNTRAVEPTPLSTHAANAVGSVSTAATDAYNSDAAYRATEAAKSAATTTTNAANNAYHSDVAQKATNVAIGAGNVAYEKVVSGLGALGLAGSTNTSTAVGDATSLPSSELAGTHPGAFSTGVGALPGKLGEEGVATLPEERVNPDPTLTGVSPLGTLPTRAPGAPIESLADHPTATGYIPQTAYNAANTATGVATGVYDKAAGALGLAGSTPSTSLPSTEIEGAQPASGVVGGAGALPGRLGEEGVATLPEERVNPDPIGAAAIAKNAAIASPYSSASPYSDTSANAVSPPHGAPGASTTESRITGKAAGAANAVGATGVAEKLHERDEKKVEEKQKQHGGVNVTPSSAPDLKSSTHNDNGHTAPSSTELESNPSGHSASTTSEQSHTKKPGFMAKMKGEIKILSGKMGKNEEKIEEGRVMKSGGSPTSPTK